MMCAERIQRIMLAIVLGFIMGMAASGMVQWAFLLQLLMIVIFLVWAFADFCLSIYVLRKILPPCDSKKDID